MTVTPDDILASLVKYAAGTSVTVKALSGSSKTVTGTLPQIFTGIQIEPRDLRQSEKPVFPCIGFQIDSEQDGLASFGACETDTVISVFADCTYKQGDKVDQRLSEANSLRMMHALRQLFKRHVIPMYSVSVVQGQAPTANGYMSCKHWMAFHAGDYKIEGAMVVTGRPSASD